jgi:hypothetical protein
MAVRKGSTFRVQLVVWRRRKDRFCAMLVSFGVCLLLTWRAEEADGLGKTPNLLVLYLARGEGARMRMYGRLFIRLL